MDFVSLHHQYIDALLFVVDVWEAAGRPWDVAWRDGEEHRSENRFNVFYRFDAMGVPYYDRLSAWEAVRAAARRVGDEEAFLARHPEPSTSGSWHEHFSTALAGCDHDSEVAETLAVPLEAVAGHLVGAAPSHGISAGASPVDLWPDLEERISLLRDALDEVAVDTSRAYTIDHAAVLEQWRQDHLDEILTPPDPDEGLLDLAARLVRGLVLASQHQATWYRLRVDRAWHITGVAPWRRLGTDLAVRSLIGRDLGHAPTFVLRLDPIDPRHDTVTGTFSIANTVRVPPTPYLVSVDGDRLTVPDELADDPPCRRALLEALATLGHEIDRPPWPDRQPGACPHVWQHSDSGAGDGGEEREPT